MAPRKYVHMLLIISELCLIACCLLMIVIYKKHEGNDRWRHKISYNLNIAVVSLKQNPE